MTQTKRIAINVGGGYVPGINNVLAGAVLAANQLDWQLFGIRDGFDGLLFPDKYKDGGLIPLTPELVERSGDVSILGNATRTDPFHVRTVDADGIIQEQDCSGQVLLNLAAQKIDAVISIVESRALSILLKLNRRGLVSVCVPKSIENDIAATTLSFGFNSALSYATETLDRARHAAESSRKIGVVEVPGKHAGWLALQSGMAARADAVLIPEIPFDLHKVAVRIQQKIHAGQGHGLVVVAEGASPLVPEKNQEGVKMDPLRAALSPLAQGGQGAHIIHRSGHAAECVAQELERLTNLGTYPLVLGQLVRGGTPTAVDRQLGLGYGAAAVRALRQDQTGVMVVFQPPELKFVPLAKALNQVRVVPADSMFVQIARELGIALGD